MSNGEGWNGYGEATSGPRRPAGEPPVLSGSFMGTRWQVVPDRERPRIVIDGRDVPLTPDGLGNVTTHLMFGRWPNLAELARAIVMYHPDYSPLGRRDQPVA